MFRHNARVVALILSALLAATQAGAQQAEPRPLAEAAPDAQLRADFKGSSQLLLAEVQRVMRGAGVAFYAFWVRSAAVPGLNVGEDFGEWRGNKDADWAQTLCRIRIHAGRNFSTDVAVDSLYVDRLWMAGTAATVREVRGALAKVSPLTDVQAISAEDYGYLRQNFQRPQETREDLYPEDFPRLPGCEAGVRRIKGWRMTDMDRTRARGLLEILRSVAANDPHQPVRLSLDLLGTSTVREVASLVDTYDIARLWLRGSYVDLQRRPATVGEIYDLIFSSAAPALHEQLERSECRMQTRMRYSQPSSAALIDLRIELMRTATVYLRVSDAVRLLESRPAWLAGLQSYNGWEFGRPGSLEVLKADFARLFLEPIRITDASGVTEQCRRYATAQ
jgi:hypothetical protein